MSQSPDHTYVQYFIPHDGDTESAPNLFLVRKPAAKLTVGDLQEVCCGATSLLCAQHIHSWLVQAFPLPGQYFFRFKQTYGKGYGKLQAASEFQPSFTVLFAVWLDQNTASAKAPLYSGKIIIKASRLSFEGGPIKAASPQAAASGAAAASTQKPPQKASAPATTRPTKAASPSASADDGDFLNLGSSSPAPAASTPQSSADGNMDEFWGL